MCSYYDRHRDPRRLEIDLDVDDGVVPNMEPRYVVKISNVEYVVAIGKDGKRHFMPMRWGLVPPWSPTPKSKFATHNARAETIMESRLYAAPFAKGRRCLVPVDGFYEFTGPDGAKQPHYFKPRRDRTMAFAGLWENWTGPKHPAADASMTRTEPFLSYTIATCEPNSIVAPIHNRMPVLLTDKTQWDLWLNPAAAPDQLLALLTPAPDDLLETYPVIRELLKIKEPGPEVLAPV
jgi:putative SOS response-associated peptidase YedK